MQLFMAFYVLLTLVIIANFINLILEVVVQKNLDKLRARLRRLEIVALREIDNHEQAKDRFGAINQTLAAGVMLILAIAAGTIFFTLVEDCTCSDLQTCDDTSYKTCVQTGGFQHGWGSSFYMSVITVTTVGFGDYSPRTKLGRAFGIVWMTVGVAVTAFFISSLSSLLAEEDDELDFEDADTIDRTCFQAMDKDNNGFLSKDEYALYVLVKHGLVPQEIIDEIHAKYQSMDVQKNGRVTYSMLKQVHRAHRKERSKATHATGDLSPERFDQEAGDIPTVPACLKPHF